jgi:hypothetical protein
MMARSKCAPFKGRIQKRMTNRLQIVTFGLHGTAGPYKSAICLQFSVVWSGVEVDQSRRPVPAE